MHCSNSNPNQHSLLSKVLVMWRHLVVTADKQGEVVDQQDHLIQTRYTNNKLNKQASLYPIQTPKQAALSLLVSNPVVEVELLIQTR